MVVSHDSQVLIVHLLEESRNVGKQIGVYFIARSGCIARRTTPVGVDDEIIEIEIVIVVLLHYRLCAFGGILVISRLPQAQRGERHHIGSAGKLYVLAAQFFSVAAHHHDVHVGIVVFYFIARRIVIGNARKISAFGRCNARAVVYCKRFGSICGRGQFSAVAFFAGVTPHVFSRFRILYVRPFKIDCVFTNIRLICTRIDDFVIAFARHGKVCTFIVTLSRNLQGVGVGKSVCRLYFETNEVFCQHGYAYIAFGVRARRAVCTNGFNGKIYRTRRHHEYRGKQYGKQKFA